ncbi:MAG: ABC transporter ATP-binding protein [Verrucomicrobiota bacterium]
MSRPIIEVRGVSKKYQLGQIGMTSLRDDVQRLGRRLLGKPDPVDAAREKKEFWALRDISFSVEPGEIVGIIGRNGAGKSTLLKVLSQITEPTSGEINLYGRIGSLLEVGTGFHPELSGRDNVFLNGAILGMRKAEIQSKFDEIVEFAEIGKFIDTPVKRYSSGMYVRLAFAVAAHLEPEILIVDEVLAVGDAQFQRKCIGRMQEISHGHGRTVLFVSHSMATIRRLCQKCVVLEGGRLRGVYPVEEAIEHYNLHFEASATDVHVGNRTRDWGTTGQDGRIMRVRSVRGGLFFNQPFSVEVTIDVQTAMESAMIGFALNTVEGQRVMTLDSDAEGRTLNLQPGRHIITLSLPRLPVSPGRYYCSASLGQGRHFFDIVDSFALWEIHPGSGDWESDRGFGGCRLQPTLQHERPAQGAVAEATMGTTQP